MNTSNKCKICEKTAYPMEALTYDGQTYHKTCFKCLECGSRVSLSGVAMIQGDLYCKNCFIQKFKVKGTYHIFGTHTMPKGLKPSDGSSSPKSSSPRAAPSAGLKKVHRHTQSVPPTSPSAEQKDVSAPEAVAEADENDSSDPAFLTELLVHIQQKSVTDVKRMLKYHGPAICLQQIDGKTMVQLAFEESSVACAQTMLSELSEYVASLESQCGVSAEPASSPASPTAAASEAAPAAAAEAVPVAASE